MMIRTSLVRRRKPADLEAVDAGQHDVDQDDVGRVAGEQLERGLARLRPPPSPTSSSRARASPPSGCARRPRPRGCVFHGQLPSCRCSPESGASDGRRPPIEPSRVSPWSASTSVSRSWGRSASRSASVSAKASRRPAARLPGPCGSGGRRRTGPTGCGPPQRPSPSGVEPVTASRSMSMRLAVELGLEGGQSSRPAAWASRAPDTAMVTSEPSRRTVRPVGGRDAGLGGSGHDIEAASCFCERLHRALRSE